MHGLLHALHGMHALSFDWPTERVDLNRAAELFALAGRPVSRSSLSRFVKNTNFPHAVDRGRKLVDGKALWDAFNGDYNREVMAGETGLAAEPREKPVHASRSAPAGPDPRRDYHAMKAEELRLKLAADKRALIPATEAAASVGIAIANLRAALHEAMNDTADALIHQLGLPAHRQQLVVKLLKDMIYAGQMKFAETFEPLVAGSTPDGLTAADYLDMLAAYAEQLHAGVDEAPAAHELEPAAV